MGTSAGGMRPKAIIAITTDDLIRFARMNDIKDAESIIAEVTKSVDHFSDFARECGIDDKWIKDIEKATH